MERDFWENKWHRGEIGFHRDEVNPALVSYFDRLNLSPGDHIFVPLCGKSVDCLWLAEQGYRVTGVELSSVAIEDFFRENHLDYQEQNGIYCSSNLTMICRDIFELSKDELDPIDAVYDRAATIALPKEMRLRYTQHLKSLAPEKVMLLITLEYNQEKFEGPPFSVEEKEIQEIYGIGQVEKLSDQLFDEASEALRSAGPVRQLIYKILVKKE